MFGTFSPKFWISIFIFIYTLYLIAYFLLYFYIKTKKEVNTVLISSHYKNKKLCLKIYMPF